MLLKEKKNYLDFKLEPKHLAIIILLCAFVIILSICTDNKNKPAQPVKTEPKKFEQEDILAHARLCIENRLKAPSSAKFGFNI